MYKIGIVGLGQIAYHIQKDPNRKIIWSHIQAYKNITQTEITGICDINNDLVEKIKIECNILKGYTDYGKMLDESKFDIISICTPIQTHFDIIKKCVESGVKAIFCEKTLSYSLEESEEIVKLCEDNNVILGVNYILRWDNLNIEIKNLIDSGAIGKIYTMVGYGATALHTSTSHLIDLMVYFSDGNPLWVMGETQKDFVRVAHGVEDCGGIGIIKFDTGVIGFIKGVSSSPQKYMLELDILGENGRIKLYNNGLNYDLYQYSKEINVAGENYESLKLIKSQQKDAENERMIEAILDIINCLENGGQPLANAKTSCNSIKIIEGIKKSDEIKNSVKFIQNSTY